MNARFIDACLAEIDEAVTWYANQSPELPERILAELQGAMEPSEISSISFLSLFPSRYLDSATTPQFSQIFAD